MPMLFAGREPNHVARINIFNCAALPLHTAATCCNNQRLPERVRVPRRTSAGLERHLRARHTGWVAAVE